MVTLVTDVLDLLGALLLVTAAALAAGVWLTPPAGLAVAGAGLLGVSWLIDHSRKRRPRSGGDDR